MSSFLNNFMGGFTFGLLSNLPFFGGWGMGCGCGYGGVGGFIFGGGYNAVNLTGFANPFPPIFGGSYMMNANASASGLIMPQGFANNSFPQIDFSSPCQTIWDTFTNPNSDYNRSMMDWFQKSNTMTNPFQITNDNPGEKEQEQQTPEKIVDKSENTEKNTKITSSQNNDKKQAERQTNAGSNEKRNFSQEYAALSITDTRYQKFLEESILGNEGQEYIKDNNGVMTNSGVQQGTYDSYRKRKKLPKQDVKYMTNKEMCEIYYDIYKECGADKINDDRMSLYVFDVAVNSGSKIAKRFYKKSGGNAQKFEQLRKEHYTHLAKSNPKQNRDCLEGWLARLDKIRKYADNNLTSVA